MSIYLEIPHEEFTAFREFIKTYSQGESLIVEGDTEDKSLFLIRVGQVAIYRQLGDAQQLISTVDAVAFVGEMELMIGCPRLATIKAQSSEVLAYRFTRADMNTIIKNPYWAETILRRLCNDLKSTTDRVIDLETENLRLKSTVEALAKQLLALQNK